MTGYNSNKPSIDPACSTERELWLDWIRGFSISIIVVGHVLLGLYASRQESIDSLGRFTILFLYSFHVPLLFFVSGAVCQDEKKKLGTFLKALSQWVVWPYFLWSFFLVFAQQLFSFAVNKVFSFETLQNCFYRPVSIFWFLYAYALIKVVSCVAFSRLPPHKALGSLFALALSAFFFSLHTNNSGIIYSTSIGLFFFALGKAYQVYKNHISFALKKMNKGIVKQAIYIFSLATLIVINYYNLQVPDNQLLPIYIFQHTILLTGSLGIVVCAYLAYFSQQLKHNMLFCWIGKHTMSIYLLHIFAIGGARYILFSFVSDVFIVRVIVLSFLGIALPLLGQIFLDRMNLNRVLGIPKVAGGKT